MRPWGLIYLLFLAVFWGYCSNQPTTDIASNKNEGKELAEIYCASCHRFPEPQLLDQATWKNYVLIRMAAFMGIYEDNSQYFDQIPEQWLEPDLGGQRVKAAKVYPEKPLLSRQEWEKIKAYYLDHAPQKLAGASPPTDIKIGIPFFKARPFSQSAELPPLIQGMGIDTAAGRLYLSVFEEGIWQFDFRGKLIGRKNGTMLAPDIQVDKRAFACLDMGTRLASDNPQGSLTLADSWEAFQTSKAPLLDHLMRPVHFARGDLNSDGLDDYVICEYGNLLGNLALYQATSDKKVFDKKILFPDDGAVRSEILDFNQDGRLDIIALQANADEGIDLYLNGGDGIYDRRRLLRFLPCYGSTYFETVDFNRDGQIDLLVSNGDNGDYFPILKPYHGVRLYQQNKGEFQESFFLPLNGVYQAVARDFDLDGDLDIAAVAFHPDFQNHPQESFVVFVNDGQQHFEAYTIPQYAQSRWMRFQCVDIDRDGDEDILLSAFNVQTPDIPSTVAQVWKNSDQALLILENKSR